MLLLSSCVEQIPLSVSDQEGWDEAVRMVLVDKKKIRVPENNIPLLIAMLENRNPEYRRAALIILSDMGQWEFLHLFIKLLDDPDTEVENEAYRIVLLKRKDALVLALNSFSGNDTDMIMASLKFIRNFSGSRYLEQILPLLSYPEEKVRKRAALTIVSMVPPDNELLLSAVDSSDPVIRANALMTLSYYKDNSVLPLIVRGFYDPDKVVRDAAQFAILAFDDAALPDLYELIATGDPNLQMMALQVLEGLKKPESLPILIPLIINNDQRINTKSRSIILSFSNEAVPYLVDSLNTRNIRLKKEIITILSDIKNPDSLGPLIKLFDNPYADIRKASEQAVYKFGETALPPLRENLFTESPVSQAVTLRLLRALHDPFLLFDENGKLSEETILLLVYQSSDKELAQYLQNLKISSKLYQDLLNLKNFIGLLQTLNDLKKVISRNSYFFYYNEWENLLFLAEKDREAALNYNHEYFKEKNSEYLELSKQKKKESLQLEEQAADFVLMAGSLDKNDIEKGIEYIIKYNEIRENLIKTWDLFSFEIKPIANRISSNEEIDINEIVTKHPYIRRQYDFIRY